jgi:hypothetical protein
MSVEDYEIQSFPAEFQKAYLAARDIVSAVTGKTFVANRAAFGLALFNLAGFAAGQVLGQPDRVIGESFHLNGVMYSTDSLAGELSDALSPMVATEEGLPVAMGKINWARILELALRILPLIISSED